MFCPKCGRENAEDASFCRGCGANISLVPQALTGQPLQAAAPPPEEVMDESCSTRRGRRKQLTLDTAFKNMFIGVAFLIIAIALSRTIGAGWWFWMLIPAFSLMGTGIAQFIRLRERDQRMLGAAQMQPVLPRKDQPVLPRRTDELRPPVASVTEGTTRHLGVEAPTRHLETQERK
jgi:hypothetical protein